MFIKTETTNLLEGNEGWTMASSLGAGGPGLAPGSSVPRRANLEFPPPPPYPPPSRHAGSSGTQSATVVGASSFVEASPPPPMTTTPPNSSTLPRHSSQTPSQDYAYAYYEPGPSRLHPPALHSNIQSPLRHGLEFINSNTRHESARRHTYVTRYGTEENIYEEISDIRWEKFFLNFVFFSYSLITI